MTEQLRKDFETITLALAVKHYRYAQSDMAMRTLFERRTDGTYACDWVDGAWMGYQAAVEAVTVGVGSVAIPAGRGMSSGGR